MSGHFWLVQGWMDVREGKVRDGCVRACSQRDAGLGGKEARASYEPEHGGKEYRAVRE
jgi:hypothetical protein